MEGDQDQEETEPKNSETEFEAYKLFTIRTIEDKRKKSYYSLGEI
jgi:hypothetical protein